MDTLLTWLRESHPSDVAMVARKGTKHPAFPHASHQWDWCDVDDLSKRHGGGGDRLSEEYDVGILLDTLCVVDVDDRGVARDLEAAFPALARASCEITRKGSHFYFRRSATCDAEGYYDGAGQRTRGVDFKTRCHGGTRGFILCAPSTDKAWVPGREPWSVELEEIPDDLLSAVAQPRHPRFSAVLQFRGGAELALGDDDFVRRTAAMHFRVVAELVEVFGDSSAPTVLPLHSCSRQEFEDLLFACQHGVPRDYPTATRTEALLRAADFLGADSFALRAYRAAGVVNRLLDVERLTPELARNMHAEALALAGAAPWPPLGSVFRTEDEEAAPPLDALSADEVVVEMLPLLPPAAAAVSDSKTDADADVEARPLKRRRCRGFPLMGWLVDIFGFGRRRLQTDTGAARAQPPPPAPAAPVAPPAATEDPDALDGWLLPQLRPVKRRRDAVFAVRDAPPSVPPFVERWLRAYDKLVLAGGAALAAVSNVPQTDDYDFFVCGASPSEAGAIVEGIRALPGVCLVHRSPRALTFEVDGLIAQIILRIYDSREHLLCSFDFDPCKVLVSAGGDGGPLAAQCSPSFRESLRLHAVVVRDDAWGAPSYVRTLKYMAKGFDVFVPCATRRRFRPMRGRPESASGVMLLYETEFRLQRDWAQADSWGALQARAASAVRGTWQADIDRLQNKRAEQDARFAAFYGENLAALLRRARRNHAASEYSSFRRLAPVAWFYAIAHRLRRGSKPAAKARAMAEADESEVRWPAAPRKSNLCPRAFEWKRVLAPGQVADWRVEQAARLVPAAARGESEAERVAEWLDLLLYPPAAHS
jgi:hypothetical protein